MQIYIDSANLEQIKQVNDMRLIDGITTNPSLIAKEYDIKKTNDPKEIILEIINEKEINLLPISVEVMSTDSEGMIKEVIELSKLYSRISVNERIVIQLPKEIVIKVPMTKEGLKTVPILEFEHNIRTNVTLVFSVGQALLASAAGASFVSIFVGRLDDISQDGMQIVRDAANIFRKYDIKTKIIAASIRSPLHVVQAAKAGADIVTCPMNVIEAMIRHPLTDIGIKKFQDDYNSTSKP